MKTLLLLFVIFALAAQTMSAQAPEMFSYQCVVRDANGDIVPDQGVSFQISLISSSVSGPVVYSETHAVTTNAFGLVTLSVGNGTVVTGDIATIDWGAAPYFVRIEIDINGATSYADMGTFQLLSVPYALYAKSAGNVFSGNYNDLTNTPDFTGWDQDESNDFSGNYNDLTNKPVLSGDVIGQTDANTVTAIQGMFVSSNLPANGQVLKWNNVSLTWEPSDDQLGAAGTTDGVVTGASVTGGVNKTLTLIRSNGLGDITAIFTDEVNDADADPANEIQTLSISGNDLTISGANTVTLPQTTYTAGTGISVMGNTISNTSPDQTVQLTGTGSTTVSGSYPNFTINSTGNVYTAGSGIDIQTNEIINTAPDQNVVITPGTGISVAGSYPNFTIANTQPGQPVSITGSGATSVSGAYPNFVISSTDNNTEYTAGNGISVQGTQIINTLPDLEVELNSGTGISVSGSYPDFTITNSNPDQVVNLNGTGSTTVSGTYPNFTINSTDNNTTYTAGTGINIVGTEIINTAPNQPVSITGGGATTVSGTYPSFTITSTDNNTTYTAGTGMNLSGTTFNAQTTSALWNASQLRGINIASGAPVNGQVLKYDGTTWAPAADNSANYTAGSGINIAGNTISNASPDQTVVLTGAGATTVSGAYPNFTITSTDNNNTYTAGSGISVTGTTISNTAPDQTVTLTGTGAATVSGSYPNFTINSTDNNTTYSAGNGMTLSGTTFDAQSATAMWNANQLQGVTVNSALPASGQVLKYNGTNWAPAADNSNAYVAGSGLTLTGNSFSHTAHTGDATGATSLTVTGIQGRQVTANMPANGQVLKWNTTNNRWELGDDQLGAAGTNDGVVTSIGVSGTTTKTITLTRSQSLPDLTATFTDDGSVYTAGSGINIASNVITNAAPDQTVTLTQGGATTISGTYPNFTISSTNTTYTAGTGMTLSGTTFNAQTTNALWNANQLQGVGVTTTAPSSGQVLKYNGTNWAPAADNNNTYTGSTGINVTGTTITNTLPDQTVFISGGGATTVSGAYPSFTISSTDNNTTYTAGTGMTLSGTTFNAQTTNALWNANQLQGYSVASSVPTSGYVLKYNGTSWAPAVDNNTTYTGSTGINVSGTTITNTAPDQTVILNGAGATTVSGTYPSFTISSTNSGGTVTSIATNNGITGGTITTTGTIGLTGQALALHNLATSGIIARTAAGVVAARTITGGSGITVSNGDGISGNPTITPTYGTTAGTIAQGNHTHATLTRGTGLTGTNYNGSTATTWAVNFGTTAGTVSEGNHAHSAYAAAGTTGMVQYNNGGAFGANSNFFWDIANGRMGVGLTTPNARLTVLGNSSNTATEPLFEVKNRAGQTVFVIYEDSVRVYVDDDPAKTNKGAFAVSGRNTSKAFTNNYFLVTPDSSRVWTNDADKGFGVKAINGTAKESYMQMTPKNYFIGHFAGNGITSGLYNSFIGYKAGYSNTTGSRNYFIGYMSGYSNIGGSGNVFVGDSTGQSNYSGFHNVFIGNQSGRTNYNGYRNVALGFQAGYSNYGGYENNFIGYRAGYSNTSGVRNVYVGHQAGYSSNTATRNTMVGSSSGYGNISGSYNSLYGHYSGYAATLGDNNVMLGYYSGYNADNASDCVFMGSNSGYNADNSSNTISIGTNSGYNNNAANNLFIGTEAGYSNTTGTKNVFMGYKAGRSNSSAEKNIFIGNHAGYNTTTQSQNICIGDSAGAANESMLNIFIGTAAGVRNTNGVSNTFIGNQAGNLNTSGGFNTYLGWLAGASNTTGNSNVAIGPFAGWNANVAENNVYVGFFAGGYAYGNGNICIGSGSGNSSSVGSNNILIGPDADCSGDNKLVVGTNALIYGDFSTRRIGIGQTTAPVSTMHVVNKNNLSGERGVTIDTDGETTDIPFRVRTVADPSTTAFTDADSKFTVWGDGHTEINGSLQISGGTEIEKLEAGQYTVGTGTGGVKTVTVTFPTAFTGTPKVTCTVRGGNFSDVFAVTTRSVSSTQFQVNIYRVDSPGGIWAQTLYLDWIAWE